ncbi:ATP-binding cassette domain-containing protein [Micromonospora sp. DT229]|uniref:ATP-binding cassette domain-containing protein n=1 Tax=Micromonospora sp. DT229 TaxID=3393430 RepID=UPI003CF5C2EE
MSVQFPAGLTFLVGVNGAGKTTLFRLLLGDLKPHHGQVLVPASAGRGRLGYLPQAFGFPPRLTVAEFVAHFAWLQGVPRRQRPARVREALERVNLADRAGDRMGTLSGGMLRRAGIAQALVHRPELLLLDEPTVGLDPKQRVDLRGLFTDLAAQTTVVVSTHLLEDVAAVGGHAVLLDEGEVRFAGSVADLTEIGDRAEGQGSPLDRAFLTLTTKEALR